MARALRSSRIESRSNRLKLPVARKPIFLRIAAGVWLGYRRNAVAGTWVLKVGNGHGSHWTKRIADADDYQTANGGAVCDFFQAQTMARTLAGAGKDGKSRNDTGRPITVEEAVDQYADDLRARGGDVGNATRIRAHMPAKLAKTVVATLTAADFRPWRSGLEGLTPAAINRVDTVLKAVLNRAAEQDERIANGRAWKVGLRALRNSSRSRNVILADSVIRQIVANAYRNVGTEFGILIELAAETGARVSQLIRLTVADVQAKRDDPRVMMPSSHKGRGEKAIKRRPVPISASLAARLPTKGRLGNALLLTKAGGTPWKKDDQTERFARVDAPAGATMYALRHSSIVRQLLGGTPIRVVAVNHDTSTKMIEMTYSEHISDHADSLSRKSLVTFAPPVIPLVRAS